MGKNNSRVFSAGLPAYILYTNSFIYLVMTSTVLNMAALIIYSKIVHNLLSYTVYLYIICCNTMGL